MEPLVIPPEVGRTLLFVPGGLTAGGGLLLGRPHAAKIVAATNSRTVNLTVFDSLGETHAMVGVPLRQPDDPPPGGDYCEWMPWTVGEARRKVAVGKVVAEQC